jgi:hypothetical protein
MIDSQRPDLLVPSVTLTFIVPALRETTRRVRARHPKLPIAAELVEKAKQRLGVSA